MFKYILKRLGLAIIVLLGVSVIIYFLVRLMPTDYLENKFSAQLQQGTITHDQLDEFKKRYGLYMPEAYLTLEVNGYEQPFEKDSKVKKHTDAENGLITPAEFYEGKYENSKENVILEINKDGTWRIYESGTENAVSLRNGTFTAELGKVTLTELSSAGAGLEREELTVNYRAANVWNKFTAVLGGYFAWLGNMLRGDLGDSFLYQQPVGKVIADHMWISFAISLVALVFQFAIAIPLGIVSATRCIR